MSLTRIYQSLLACVLSLALAQSVIAQSFTADPGVGSETENHLRNLQLTGKVPLYPWTIRPFSPAELDNLLGRPKPQGLQLQLISPSITTYYNSQFPYGLNDGPVWQGRGLTTAIQAGITARWGRLSLALAPIYVRAANKAFDLVPNAQTGAGVYAHPLFPTAIDLPQRFGGESYSFIDLGQSTLRWDSRWVTTGISTANQWWGPAVEYPYLLGNNAAGFPHAFLGTARPINLRILKAHTRLVWGSLSQSDYSPVTGSEYYIDNTQPGRKRFMSGVATSVTPGFTDKLEIGLARFYHSAWPESGLEMSDFFRPLEAFVNANGVQTGLPQNQLASFWFRWVLPNSGFEFYGEYGREDYNIDLKDLYLEPDHLRSYNAGFRKVFGDSASNLKVFRAEWFNGQLGTQTRHRAANSRYIHSALRQGHTHKGQLLGTPVGVGAGAGTTVAFDQYTKGGRWSVTIRRLVTMQQGTFYAGGSQNLNQDDILPSLEVENVCRLGAVELTTGLGTVIPTRNFYRSGSPNILAKLSIRYIHL